MAPMDAISMEQRRKDTVNKTAMVYHQATLGNVSPSDSVVLHHHARIDEIVKWTKDHQDAYLASSADMIIDPPT
jgi:hypothetical protein